jgi:Tol biopolymer transport system component
VTAAAFSLRGSPLLPVMRFTIPPPENTSFSSLALNTNAFANSGVVSPDGTRIVFAAGRPKGKSQLWLRSFDSLSAKPLADTDDAAFPFWSFDSRQVAFFSQGRLRKIDVATGSVQSLASLDAPIRGGAWSRRGELVFGVQGSPDLYRVSDQGGQPRRVEGPPTLANDATMSAWPSFLPDGRHFVYAAFPRAEDTETVIYVGDLDASGATRLLSTDSNAIFAEPNHLLFVRNGVLTRQTLDPASRSLSQDPTRLAEGVTVDARQRLGAFSASATTLAYRTGGGAFTQFARLDQQGHVLATLGPEGMYRNPIFDSTESRLLFSRATDGARWDVWFLTIPQGAMSRVTFNSGTEGAPVWWTENRILYWHRTPGGGGIFAKALSEQQEELVLDSPTPAYPYSVRSDGSSLLYVDAATGAFDIFALPLSGDRKPKALVGTPFHDDGPQFSPDGRFFAYFSYETGRSEVYVQPFPPNGTRWPISTDTGIRPMWGLDGKELFFARLDGRLYSVPIRIEQGSLHAGTPEYRFDLNAAIIGTRNSYVPTRDGGFVVNRTSNQVGAPINVVVNWQHEAR